MPRKSDASDKRVRRQPITAAGAMHHSSLPECKGWENTEMLHYAVVFFIIAIIAAILGFGGIAAGAAGIAKILFFVFLVLALVTFLRRA
jgi:uncharacterized membrane protein YtjA (UPF0391 family)